MAAKKKTEKEKKREQEQEQRPKTIVSALEWLNDQLGMKPKKLVESGIEFIPSGSVVIDQVSGGGYPKKRITEIYGEEQSGKTTIATHACISAASRKESSVYLDYEHTLDLQYAQKIADRFGVKFDKYCYVYQPPDFESGEIILDKVIKTGDISLAVVDSVAAMKPRSSMEGKVGEEQIGLHARFMSQMAPRLSRWIAEYNTAFIFINQIRERIKINQYEPGPAQYRTGGNALKYYASIRLKLKQIDQEKGLVYNPVKGGKELKIVRSVIDVFCEKNKTSPPKKNGSIVLTFGMGIDNERSIIDIAINVGKIKKGGGGYYSFDLGRDLPKLQGIDQLMQFVRENRDVYDELLTHMPWANGAAQDEDRVVDTEKDEISEILDDFTG